MSKTRAVGGFRSGAGGLPSVFPNGSRTVNATGCPCSPGALKQQRGRLKSISTPP